MSTLRVVFYFSKKSRVHVCLCFLDQSRSTSISSATEKNADPQDLGSPQKSVTHRISAGGNTCTHICREYCIRRPQPPPPNTHTQKKGAAKKGIKSQRLDEDAEVSENEVQKRKLCFYMSKTHYHNQEMNWFQSPLFNYCRPLHPKVTAFCETKYRN